MRFVGNTLILSVIGCALLSGCNTPGGSGLTANQPPAAPVKSQEEDVPNQLKAVISQAKEPREVASFLNDHIKQADTKTADQMFIAFEQYANASVPVVDGHFKNMLTQPGTAERLYELGFPMDFTKIKGDDKLKQWLLDQQAGKLALRATSDMSFYWEVDYEAMQEYAPRLSGDLQEYLSLKTTETKHPSSGDGGLRITRTELAERIVQAEHYLVTYPAGQKKADIKAMYTDAMKLYLSDYRYDAIDERTMKLLPQVKQDYLDLVKKYPDTKTAQIVSDYVKTVQRNNDVIFEFGKKGESIIGEAKPTIFQFWDKLGSRIDQLFT